MIKCMLACCIAPRIETVIIDMEMLPMLLALCEKTNDYLWILFTTDQ